jgi:hypothetical protein
LQEHEVVGPCFTHASPAAHAVPPQVQRAVPVLQLPFAPPLAHWELLVQPQTAPWQVKPPERPWAAQSLAQLPQWLVEVPRSTSQPSSAPEAGWLQSPNPAAHVCSHAPLLHAAPVELLVLHARLHDPQCATSVSDCSQPLPAALSQFPKPPAQVESAHRP